MDIKLSDHFSYGKLLRFTFSSIMMMVFTSIYGVVDGFFVSNFAGKTAFAAVNFIMPVLMIFGAVGFMFGTGGSALISKTMGEGNNEKAQKLFSMIVYVSIAVGVVFAVLAMFLTEPVARLMGADDAMIQTCVLYAKIVLCALPALMLQYEFQSFFVTAQKPQLGLYVTLVSGIANMVLDFLFVAVMNMGVAGAAIATAISQYLGGFIPLIYFSKKNSSLLRITKTNLDWYSLLKTMTNGSSEFLSNISMSLVGMLYNVQLMKYASENGVAAYGTLMYVNMIFIAVFIGYSVGTAPIIGFCYGAKNHKELKSILKKSIVIIGIFSILMLIAAQVLAYPLGLVFVGYDAKLLEMTLHAFAIFAFSFLFAGFTIFASSFFTALNNGLVSALISFLRTVVFQVAAVLILPILFDVDGIWFSIVVAEVVAVIASVIFWAANRKKYNY